MAIGQAAAGTPGGGSALGRALAPLLQPRTLTATIYLLVSMFVGLTWHVVLATGLLLGVGTLIIWIGVFVLALTLLAWRGGAWLERRWVRAMLGVDIPDPYGRCPPDRCGGGPGCWPPTPPPGRTWPTWSCCSRWG